MHNMSQQLTTWISWTTIAFPSFSPGENPAKQPGLTSNQERSLKFAGRTLRLVRLIHSQPSFLMAYLGGLMERGRRGSSESWQSPSLWPIHDSLPDLGFTMTEYLATNKRTNTNKGVFSSTKEGNKHYTHCSHWFEESSISMETERRTGKSDRGVFCCELLFKISSIRCPFSQSWPCTALLSYRQQDRRKWGNSPVFS